MGSVLIFNPIPRYFMMLMVIKLARFSGTIRIIAAQIERYTTEHKRNTLPMTRIKFSVCDRSTVSFAAAKHSQVP